MVFYHGNGLWPYRKVFPLANPLLDEVPVLYDVTANGPSGGDQLPRPGSPFLFLILCVDPSSKIPANFKGRFAPKSVWQGENQGKKSLPKKDKLLTVF